MNNQLNRILKYFIPVVVILPLLLCIGVAIGGELDPSTPPGRSPFHSLEEIFAFLNDVDTQTRLSQSKHNELPSEGPSPTMHTTSDIYKILQRLPATGAETSYAPGDDGFIQAGAKKRYTFSSSINVADNNTNLEWIGHGNLIGSKYGDFDHDDHQGDGLVTWYHALVFVQKMNESVYNNYGHSDWRLPNVIEMATIVDYGKSKPAVNDIFYKVETMYWTSTVFDGNSKLAFLVDMNTGDIMRKETTYGAKVIAVRSMVKLNETTYNETRY
jgi:uncharacterized protein DUF1566